MMKNIMKNYKSIFKEIEENDFVDELPLSSLISKTLFKYFIKNKVSPSRAKLAVEQVMSLVDALIKDSYSMSTARLLDRYLNKFFDQIQ